MADMDRVRSVTAELKTTEKAALTQIADGATRAFPALRIPSIRLPKSVSPFYVSAVPFAALGAAFDLELCRDVFRALSTFEAISDSAFGPVIPAGVLRSPFAQGDFIGEDAVAVSQCVSAMCEGSVLPPIAALILDGTDRTFDVRALVEIFLKPYLDNRAGLGGVIAAGGAVNGCRCTDKPFSAVYDKSKPIFVQGYDVVDAVSAVRGGVGLTLDADGDTVRMLDAIENGTLDERALDRMLIPLIARCVDYNTFRKTRLTELEIPNMQWLCTRAAEQSTVLLKNTVLPVADCVTFDWRTLPRPRGVKQAAANVQGKNVVAVLDLDNFDGAAVGLAALKQAALTLTVVFVGTHAADISGIDADAVLYAPYFDRDVVERIVRGEWNPSGRLPFTWGEKESDYPSQLKRGNRPLYAVESVYVGYRGFDAFDIRPAYPFGHGLDYLDVSVTVGKPSVADDAVRLPFTAYNAAARKGERVFMAYATFPDADVFGVERRLVGFTRLSFGGNEKVDGEIVVKTGDMAVFDKEENAFVLPGSKAVFTVEGAASVAVKIGKKGKVDGYGRKDAPSYWPQATFNPLGVETERLLGVKAFTASDADATAQPIGKVSRGKVAAVCKKYRLLRADRPRVKRFLDALPAAAVEKLAARNRQR